MSSDQWTPGRREAEVRECLGRQAGSAIASSLLGPSKRSALLQRELAQSASLYEVNRPWKERSRSTSEERPETNSARPSARRASGQKDRARLGQSPEENETYARVRRVISSLIMASASVGTTSQTTFSTTSRDSERTPSI